MPREDAFLTSSLPLTEILLNHFFQLHNCNNHTKLKFHIDSQVNLNMNKASNFAEKRRNRKNNTKPYDRILEVARIQVSSDTEVNVLLSRHNYLRFRITYPTGRFYKDNWVVNSKNQAALIKSSKKYPLFCFETQLLQVSSDTPTSGISSSMKMK